MNARKQATPEITRRVSIAPLAYCLLAVLSGCATVATTPPRPLDLAMFDLQKYHSVQDRLGQSRDITVVVAISGGGFRAANLGVGALLAMERIPVRYQGRESNLLKEVDYFTTVSGGGFAPGLYLQGMLSKPEQDQNNFRFETYLAKRDTVSGARSDRLPAIQKTLFWRLLGYSISPNVIFGDVDRGDYLQDRLDRTVLKRSDCTNSTTPHSRDCWWTLRDIFREPGSHPTTPYWITNATNYTNGEIFSFTPDNLCARKVTSYTHRGQTGFTNCGANHQLALDVPLALGMRTSSNFPVGIPATTLEIEGGSRIKLADGGQADNLAFYSALEILHQDEILYQDAKAAALKLGVDSKERRRILIVIDAFKGSLGNTEESAGSPNFAKTLVRSPSLPMDALRSRIRASLSPVELMRRSEVDSVLLNSSLAVAYINIDDEVKARSVGTTLWLDETEQRELIASGFRQAYATITGACTGVHNLSELGITVSCQGENGGEIPELTSRGRGMIEYNYGLVKQRRSELNRLRSSSLSNLAKKLVQLQSAIQRRLAQQQSADAIETLEEVISDFDKEKETRAKSASSKELKGGRLLYVAAIRFRKLFNETEKRPVLRSDNKGVAAKELACRSVNLYRSWGFKEALPPMDQRTCAPIARIRLGQNHRQKLGGMLSEVAVISDLCTERWSGFSVCNEVITFRSEVESALGAYAAEMARKAALDGVALEERDDNPQSDCTDSLVDTEYVARLAALETYDVDGVGKMMKEKIRSDTSKLLREVGGLPRTATDLRSMCPALWSSKQASVKDVEDPLTAMTSALDTTECVLRALPEAWKENEGRIPTNAASLFLSIDRDNICGTFITRIPERSTHGMGP